MVQAMDAFKRPIVCEWSVRANTRVLAYMQNSRTAPAKASIRFTFFHQNHPLHPIKTLVYYIKSKRKLQMNTKEYMNMSRTLLDQWRDIAYDEQADRGQLQNFWGTYFQIEKEIYEKLLSNPDEEVKGTVKELAEKYGQEVLTMVGFLDGINESLKEENPIETMEEDTVVSLAFDKEKLYKNMVAAKADWLYELPQWKEIYSEEELKKLYKEQKESTTIRKGKKVGRNDPCPCGSGKKYKKCCGR